MCGIFGCIGKENIINTCLNGLKKLEYRGYDSSGISFIINNKINTIKSVGKIINLEQKIINRNINSHCAIMHTRWATHGEVSEINAHPHSFNGVSVVHNGIIENYLQLKTKFNISCVSQTDTEVIVHLINKFTGTNLEKLKQACAMLEGSYALAVLFENEPYKIYVAKNKSPVVIAKNENSCFVCSDANALTECESAIYLEDNCFAEISCEKIAIFNNSLKKISKYNEIKIVSNTENKINNFKHFMLKEIFEVPESIKHTVINNSHYETLLSIFTALNINDIENIFLIGCGTAFHACMVGEQLFNQIGLNAHSYIASEFRYADIHIPPKSLAIFISQSGETADTLACVEKCNNLNLKTLAITNVQFSSITKIANKTLYTFAGSEVAVASTKAYNCQLTLLFLLRNFLKYLNNDKKEQNFGQECENLIKITNNLLNNELILKLKKLSYKYRDVKNFFLIGRLGDGITAKEGALKLKEITYNNCESYPSGELKHGTISLIDNNSLVICYATKKQVYLKSLVALEEVKCRGAKTILITCENFEVENRFDEIIKIKDVPELYSELTSIEVMQLFSYFLCVELGLDPDKPRNLAKSVTVE